MSYCNFSEVCKKKRKIKKKNMKNIIRQTLKVSISVTVGEIWPKLGMECALPQGSFHSKNGEVIIELQMHKNGIFLAPFKYLLVCHMPTLATYDTLSCENLNDPETIRMAWIAIYTSVLMMQFYHDVTGFLEIDFNVMFDTSIFMTKIRHFKL